MNKLYGYQTTLTLNLPLKSIEQADSKLGKRLLFSRFQKTCKRFDRKNRKNARQVQIVPTYLPVYEGMETQCEFCGGLNGWHDTYCTVSERQAGND